MGRWELDLEYLRKKKKTQKNVSSATKFLIIYLLVFQENSETIPNTTFIPYYWFVDLHCKVTLFTPYIYIYIYDVQFLHL